MLRFLPQLNKGIQLLNEGNINHLYGYIPIFEALNESNTTAIEAINRLLPLNQNLGTVNQSNNVQLSATIVIQDDEDSNSNSNENPNIQQLLANMSGQVNSVNGNIVIEQRSTNANIA
jgi:hypothetical protein